MGGAWAAADRALQYGLRRRLNALPDDTHQRMVFGNASDAAWDGWTEFEPWLDWKAWQPDTTLRDEAGAAIPYQTLPSEALVGIGAGGRPTRLLLHLSVPPNALRVVTIHPGEAPRSGPGPRLGVARGSPRQRRGRFLRCRRAGRPARPGTGTDRGPDGYLVARH